MLKSTYKKEEAAPEPQASSVEPDLPPGWTAHNAPNGHTYYYNADTKKSTYVKPEWQGPPQSAPIPSYSAGEFAGGFAQSSFAPLGYPDPNSFRDEREGQRGGHRPQNNRREPQDRPKHTCKIPAIKPWVLVKTKLGRRFVHNIETRESLWRFPSDVLKGVTEWDIKQREKAERRNRGEPSEDDMSDVDEDETTNRESKAANAQEEDGSEYTEVEVTDSEDEDEETQEGPTKRHRIEEPVQEGPIEFDEDDLAAELEDMEEYGFEDDWGNADVEPLSEEDSKALFFDLLDDFKINPFKTWEKVIEEGSIIDDPRYKSLANMKSRRAAWDEWARLKIQEQREARERQAKKDPKIGYLAFLEENASTKLYWPEFKRKYRKEKVMKETRPPEKEREKLYREYVKCLQLPQSTLKSDFTTLLKSLPLSSLNRDTSTSALPPALLTDLRYISLSPSVRDPLIETYIASLPPAPENILTVEEEAEAEAKRKDRARRQDALTERERRVDEIKRRQRKDLHYGKGRLREEEVELQRAMNVGRSGLKSQLENVTINDQA